MKITTSGPVGPGGLRPATLSSAQRATSARSATGASHVAPGDAIDPVARIAVTIPPEEMTGRVRETIAALVSEVTNLRRELEQKNARILELEKLADTDPLLPVANRRAFVRELERTMSYTGRYNVPASILFFDMDGLKQINDTYGHHVGDRALMHMVEVLKSNVRASDMVARLGGDELAVILTHADEAQARAKADNLLESLRATPLELETEKVTVRASVGVYTLRPGESPEDMLRKADEAMYRQKASLRSVEQA